MNLALRWQSLPGRTLDAEQLGRLASLSLKLEVETYPKPGLVSHVDNGAHRDMDAVLLCRSAETLMPVPLSSWCKASVKERTKALLA